MGGSFGRSLFGGSKTTQQSTSIPTDLTPQPFKDLQQPFADALQSFLTTQGGPEYTGPLNANIGANEQTLLDSLMAQTGAGTARSGVINDTLAGKFLPGGAGSNPFLEAAIKAAQRPTLEGLTETLSRALPGRFTANGQFIQPNTGGQGGSSAFDRAAGIATRGAASALGDIATNMSFGGYEAERGRQENAVSLSRAEVDSTVTNLQAQALPRLIQELGIERGLAEFQRRTTSLLEVLKTIGGVTQPTIAQTAQSTGESVTQKGIVPGIAELASAGAFGKLK